MVCSRCNLGVVQFLGVNSGQNSSIPEEWESSEFFEMRKFREISWGTLEEDSKFTRSALIKGGAQFHLRWLRLVRTQDLLHHKTIVNEFHTFGKWGPMTASAITLCMMVDSISRLNRQFYVDVTESAQTLVRLLSYHCTLQQALLTGKLILSIFQCVSQTLGTGIASNATQSLSTASKIFHDLRTHF